MIYRLEYGDCLEKMNDISDGSIDMILCDLPYGTTACKWDIIIPFEPLWEQYKRVIKVNGAIILFGSQPFTSALVMSNPKMFKYDWIWEKPLGIGFLNAKKQPLRNKEDILVFYKNQCLYSPQMSIGKPYTTKSGIQTIIYGTFNRTTIVNEGFRYPKQVLKFKSDKNKLHPTQKPVALCEYLIKTYTNEGNIVLDNCMGSGTTGVACQNTNRNFIGIEKDEKYFEIATNRMKENEKIDNGS